MVFGKPVQRIVDHEPAHAIAIGSVKIDGLSPRGMMSIGEAGSEIRKIVSFWTEMVIDHVHYDREPVLMAGIHKFFQAPRTAVG